ncbi:hypothetical protein HKD37_10G026958 [Glycine soja]
MDHVINWFSLASSLSEFQPTIDRIVNGIVSQTSCLATKINLIVEKFTGHKFSGMSNTSVENYALLIDWGSSFLHSLQHTKDLVINRGSSFLHNLQHTMNPVVNEFLWKVISPVVSLPWKVISGGVRLLWKLISGVVWLLWKLISGVVLWLGKVIRKIFCCCCKRGRTMKAPGRNIRIYRNVFERSPRNYFRILRSDQRMLLV